MIVKAGTGDGSSRRALLHPQLARAECRLHQSGQRQRPLHADVEPGCPLPPGSHRDRRRDVAAGRHLCERWPELWPRRVVSASRSLARRPDRRVQRRVLATRRRRRCSGRRGTRCAGSSDTSSASAAHPRGAIGGHGTSWTAFNVFSGGRWSIEIFAGPTALKPALVMPNWFVWDTAVLDRSGQSMLLASRVAPGTSIPGRGFDVLRWSRRGRPRRNRHKGASNGYPAAGIWGRPRTQHPVVQRGPASQGSS
jgi:hypothetical protein